MIYDQVKLSKLIRKCTKNAWYTTSYNGITFNYRFISVCDLEHWNGYLHSIKVNLEVEVTESRFEYYNITRKIKRENNFIRNFFFYRDSNDITTLLNLFSLDAKRISIKSIKRKK